MGILVLLCPLFIRQTGIILAFLPIAIFSNSALLLLMC
jgi:hypothetical protein